MIEQEINLSLGEIKMLYEYFANQYQKEGITITWSKVIIKNLSMLIAPYKQIIDGMYDENKDEKFKEYIEKRNTLIQQYVDRNEQGQPVLVNNEPKITEMIVEYQDKLKELNEEYKELIEKLNKKNEINNNFLQQNVKIKIYKVEEKDIPNVIPPYIVSVIIA